jgi:septal ring factor EnvC (AmiA/AmiB activator)
LGKYKLKLEPKFQIIRSCRKKLEEELNKIDKLPIKDLESTIKSFGTKNEKVLHQMKVTERTRDEVEQRIREQIKRNRELN